MSDLTAEAEDLACRGRFEEACKKYDEAIAEDANDVLAFIGKASVLKATGKYEACAEELVSALKILPGWEVAADDAARYTSFCSMLHVLRAEALLYAGRIDEGAAELDTADAVRPADAASLVVRAQVYAQKKQWKEAGDALYRAEEWCYLHDDSMLTQVWLSKMQFAKEAGGIFAPPYAAEVYASGNWKKPVGTADELALRAENLTAAGLLYDALRYYDACLAAGPENRAHILFLKGVLFERLRRFDDAFSTYADALAAAPAPDEEFMIRVRWSNAKALRG